MPVHSCFNLRINYDSKNIILIKIRSSIRALWSFMIYHFTKLPSDSLFLLTISDKHASPRTSGTLATTDDHDLPPRSTNAAPNALHKDSFESKQGDWIYSKGGLSHLIEIVCGGQGKSGGVETGCLREANCHGCDWLGST